MGTRGSSATRKRGSARREERQEGGGHRRGPAGITASVLPSSKGHGITPSEELDSIGGAVRPGIPESRLPHSKLEVTGRGLLATDGSGTTSRPRVFAVGDIVTGPRTVVEAVARAKVAAEALDERSGREPPKPAARHTPRPS